MMKLLKKAFILTMVGAFLAACGSWKAVGAGQARIGERLTYTLTTSIFNQAGARPNLRLIDTLDRGLTFAGCTGITSNGFTTTVPGGFAAICANPVVSEWPPGSTAAEDVGRRVQFDFGDVTNPPNASGTVIYEVIVINNQGNQRGASLSNNAQWLWAGGSFNPTLPAPVLVTEPTLNITLGASSLIATTGTQITFTVFIEHDPASDADAYDVVVLDTLPTALSYVPGSLTWTFIGLLPDNLDASGLPTLSATWNTFPVGSTSEIEFQATVSQATPGSNITNTANVEWTSLPGDVSSPQSANLLSTERYYVPGDPINVYGQSASVTLRVPALPDTGFPSDRVTLIPDKREADRYTTSTKLSLEIPQLRLHSPIVGIPLTDEGWDVSWLWNDVGYLDGTAFPTLSGNTVLTAHNYLSDGSPGPFVDLALLRWGDEIMIHAGERVYIYEVREVQYLRPDELELLVHREHDWVILLTCNSFDEILDEYLWRLAVKAVLIEVQ